jgi:hypothetical protein
MHDGVSVESRPKRLPERVSRGGAARKRDEVCDQLAPAFRGRELGRVTTRAYVKRTKGLDMERWSKRRTALSSFQRAAYLGDGGSDLGSLVCNSKKLRDIAAEPPQ